jgi:hypothetical protein
MKKLILLLTLSLLVTGCSLNLSKNQSAEVGNNIASESSDQKLVEVSTFYDGKEGYFISIPTGNSSTCIWTYVGGNGAVPYSETTFAKTATEKHVINSDDFYDFKVICVDDFGNQYNGVFPQE